MQLRRTFLAALACGSLALASCGGDDGSADTTLENVTTLAPADAAAREQQALLTLQDLPAGFMVSPEQAD